MSKTTIPSVFDYADYVEMACMEEDATYRNYPSAHDASRSAHRFLPAKRPENPLAVPLSYQSTALNLSREYERDRYQLFGTWHHVDSCPYCKSSLTISEVEPQISAVTVVTLRVCANCGWWDIEEEGHISQEKGSSHYSAPATHRRAVLREFSVADRETPLNSLRAHLLRRPDDLGHVSPRKLEDLVGGVFRELMNCEVIHVGGPNDEGIDLILVDGERRYVVQVKRRRTANKAEPVHLIREFLGAMVLQGVSRGIFVSTASRFSGSAQRTAKRAKRANLVEYISLVDAKKLLDVFRLTASTIPPRWKDSLSTDEDVSDRMTPSRSRFMEILIGHPDWRYARSR